jgi:hypothetical protein
VRIPTRSGRIRWNLSPTKVERMTDSGELSEPVQDGSVDATREQKIAGLASQVAADLALRPHEDLLAGLRVRLLDAGITVEEDELIAIAGTIVLGR